MCVVAHPDDAEFMFAGTIAKWTRAGTTVTYVIVTKGDKGSADPAMTTELLTEIREREQRDAAELLGVAHCEFLGYPDGYLQHTLELRRDITRLIRKYRPDVLMTFDPETRFFGGYYPNHPDHRAVGDATIDAMFPSARDRLTFPELLGEGLEPHKVREVYIGSSLPKCDAFIDIGAHLETKFNALAAHKSQMGDWDFRPMLTGCARDTAAFARYKAFPGAEAMEYAEAFKYLKLD